MLPNTENTPIHTTSLESTRLAPNGNKAGQPRVTIALSPSRTTLTRRPTRGNLKAHSTNTTRLATPHAGPWLNATKKSQPNCQRSPNRHPPKGRFACSLSGRQGRCSLNDPQGQKHIPRPPFSPCPLKGNHEYSYVLQLCQRPKPIW